MAFHNEFKVMAFTHIVIHRDDATLCGDGCPHLDVSGRIDQVESDSRFREYDYCTLFTNKNNRARRLNHMTGNRTPDGDWRWPKRCAACKQLRSYMPMEAEARVVEERQDFFSNPTEHIPESQMRTFRMESDITFSATDIDHAFEKLAEHFDNLTNGADSKLIQGGEIKVGPCEKN